MQKILKSKKMKMCRTLAIWMLIAAMLIQPLSVTGLTMSGAAELIVGGTAQDTILSGPSSGIGMLQGDDALLQLKKDMIKSLNQDLVYQVSELELSGRVGVILTFSDKALISSYASTARNQTYQEYREGAAAEKMRSEIMANQNKVLDKLLDEGLITEVKYQYCHMLDGAYVKTTYEQIEKIMAVEGVERVMISNTYEPAEAVENPVNVYDTGIFNSGDVTYTGKGTLVAILDTGCDYTHTAFTTHDVAEPAYDRAFVEGLLQDTVAYGYDTSVEAREVYYGNITKNKIVYGYDYADKDPDIMPFNNHHGTHVAGIIGGKDETITGVAVDTQFAIMKVFSDYADGGDDGDILAALEDAIVLGVDAINMSLGSSSGFTREADDEYKNDLYDRIEQAGISLIVAASNDFSSGFGSVHGNTNKASNPDSATVGAPSTYNAALSVASINGNKDKYMVANGEQTIFFTEAVDTSAKEYDFFAMLGITEGQSAEFEYVTIPGVGMAINYAGLDMTGKIALVRRGDITFEEKIQFAYEAGAIAVIIYNNVFGDIAMTVGNDAKIPAVSVGKDEGDILAQQKTGKIVFDLDNQAGPFMSDFSSWGPSPDLSLKPEITAHGGNILSAVPGGGYEKMSGTSMAAPNMCGIVVLIRQHVKEAYPDLTVEEVRDMVNQLCMSTATIALDRHGNPYSPRKQGAGIADIKKATSTEAYLYVDGIDKTKLELGDDPERTGVYTMSINLKNLSDKTVSYKVGNITMTESLSTSDPEFVAEIGYLLSNSAEYSVTNGTLEGDILSVPAGQTATVTVTLTLSAEDKAYMNVSFVNGMYVEGFLTFTNQDENGVDLNAPFLAFYGDWSEAPIFDLDYYEVETEAHNNAIDDDDKIKADYYATTPLGAYYYDYILPLGSYVYTMSPDDVAIPATEDKAAISYYADCISGIYGVFAGLLRGAKELDITITNATTGEVVWNETKYNCYKSHYTSAPTPYMAEMDVAMADYETGEVFGYNNTRYIVTLNAKLDWDGNRNSNDTYSFSFYIDYEAPTVTDATFRTEYDKSEKKNRYYVDMMVYDNHYAMSVRPIVVYDVELDDGEMGKTYASLSEYPTPVYQDERGQATKVTLEITDYIDRIRESSMPEGITIYLDDYAMNSGVCYIPFPETDNSNLEFISSELDMGIHQTADLTTYLAAADGSEITTDYLKTLTWASSDESVVAINGGQVEALKAGTATITVTGDTWTYQDTEKGETVEKQLYKTLVITVGEEIVDDPNSSVNVQIKSLDFSHYETLFAFNGDIDYSEIGETGSTNYFGGNNSISCYPSEQVKLFYSLEPWNLSPDRYTLKWSSSNPRVATVDENGVVTAQSEGKARITLQITIDGKTSLLAARCAVEVKSEFVISGRSLVAYKGKGGEVIIPDDEGITTIGAFAFAHFDLDNEKEVEKDEDGNYDFDDKKEPLGNKTVTSVVIPEGVETIEKYAFYNSEVLREVVLPSTCNVINEYAFADCEILENVNLGDVTVISNYAFYNCESLTCDALGGIDLSSASVIGDYAFASTRIASATLTNLSRSGVGAFKDCSKLKSVELGQKTRLAKNMFENTPLESIVTYCDTIPDQAFKNCEKLKEVVFNGDLTYLGVEAFYGCEKLESVTFNGMCEEIASYAFYGCEDLEALTLPNCTVNVRDAVFADCGLEKLVFAENTYLAEVGVSIFENVKGMRFDASASAHYLVEDGVVYSKDKTVLVFVQPDMDAKNFEVPASVKVIADGAFASSRNLTTVTFAEGSQLERIGYGAFACCRLLNTVELPARDIEIDEMAFYESKRLKSINLEQITKLGDFAFENTALSQVNLPKDNVVIGYGAFYNCGSLSQVTLGAGVQVGPYAFYATPVQSVEILGGGVTVDEGAFSDCYKLTSFDFSKLTGRVGDYAFYKCTSITKVNMPDVTEIGIGCFADDYALHEFSAEKLEVIGDQAFAPFEETAVSGASFEEFYAPNLRVIGESAFYGCIYLEEIDLSKVESLGVSAFANCFALEKVTLGEKLTELPDLLFYGCTFLKDLDLQYVKKIGMGVFYQVELPKHLDLPSVEHISSQAFVVSEGMISDLESVNAPNLTFVGDQAFLGNTKLKSVYAPKLETISYGAFAYTAIEEMEISDALKTVEFSVFEGDEKFTGFYAMVDGEKVYNREFSNVMIHDGVLYSIVKNGYVLSVYPAGKTNAEYTVVDNTVRIEYTAAMGNQYLEKVELPESLRHIGNYAFYQCTGLKTVVFHSYYAPILEGTVTGETIEITPETRHEYPGFDLLYRYDYYYRESDMVAMAMYYLNFVDVVGSQAAWDITCVLPETNEGYDALLYSAYFKPSDENSGATIGKYAKAFIDAARQLPETATRFDKKLIDAAINAYNALESRADELATVDQQLIDHFLKCRSEYNVSVAENKIAHLFDLDNSEYAFEIVKDARASFQALTAEEQAMVSNADRLSAKIEELRAVMGVEVDFSKTYSQHFPQQGGNENPGTDTQPTTPTGTDQPGRSDQTGMSTGMIILIVCVAVALVAGVVLAVIWSAKKKKPENENENEEVRTEE